MESTLRNCLYQIKQLNLNAWQANKCTYSMDKRQYVRVISSFQKLHRFTFSQHSATFGCTATLKNTWLSLKSRRKSRFEAQIKQQSVLIPQTSSLKSDIWCDTTYFGRTKWLINYSLCVGTETTCRGSPWTFTSYSIGAQLYHNSRKKLSLRSWFIKKVWFSTKYVAHVAF